ncbi:hypothetical protein PP175_29260 (plasmid) [Aneurinibacillus sp. Ricciae_BoGa-3]|uniref:hypothetical protein n=1 Tax=Aneurinibacillus sp. Ricciae_BoGa-3 TaxID=3022697 RepID=UPI00233FCE12|nr:hypothetical protein [Aneurinibacillus sp. Ricciae_BoGa-3]WCK57281.1 hypothetical protein PP175_29260 [Aneurinibacillus sp. Ricciae_BoGa-3]
MNISEIVENEKRNTIKTLFKTPEILNRWLIYKNVNKNVKENIILDGKQRMIMSMDSSNDVKLGLLSQQQAQELLEQIWI